MSFSSKIDNNNESGQALVLVLLSLAVVLTLVLFVLSRSVTDVAVSSRQEEAVRAFSAAEAGVERALVIGGSSGSTQIGDATYKASVTSYAEGSTDFNYPIVMASGDTATVWFTAHDTDGNLVCDSTHQCFTGDSIKVCWGKSGTSANSATTPAIEIITYYETTPGDASTVKVARAALDPNSGRRGSNSFSAPDSGSCTIAGVNYAFQKTFLFSDLGIAAGSYQNQGGLEFMGVRMLYNTDTSHEVGVTVNFPNDSTLPSQGQAIDSSGISGESNRRLSVFQGWPEVPSIFTFSVYSSTGLTK